MVALNQNKSYPYNWPLKESGLWFKRMNGVNNTRCWYLPSKQWYIIIRVFIRICIRLWLVVIFCVIQCWIFLSLATCNFCLPFCEVVICLLLFFDNFFSLRICLIPFYLLFYSLRVFFTEKKIICICIRYYAFFKLVYLSDTNYNGCIEVSFW